MPRGREFKIDRGGRLENTAGVLQATTYGDDRGRQLYYTDMENERAGTFVLFCQSDDSTPEKFARFTGYDCLMNCCFQMKTVSVALVLCLNVGVDPPDIVKTQPCARLECWIGIYSTLFTSRIHRYHCHYVMQL